VVDLQISDDFFRGWSDHIHESLESTHACKAKDMKAVEELGGARGDAWVDVEQSSEPCWDGVSRKIGFIGSDTSRIIELSTTTPCCWFDLWLSLVWLVREGVDERFRFLRNELDVKGQRMIEVRPEDLILQLLWESQEGKRLRWHGWLWFACLLDRKAYRNLCKGAWHVDWESCISCEGVLQCIARHLDRLLEWTGNMLLALVHIWRERCLLHQLGELRLPRK